MATNRSTDLEVLEQLRERERELDAALQQARHEGEALLTNARAEATRIRQAARGELSEELARVSADHQRRTEELFAQRRQEVARRLEALRQAAHANRERAIALVVHEVLGERP
ncbi:MAG: V-type ATPase subunit subunit G family protein [Myxococcota bacterium]